MSAIVCAYCGKALSGVRADGTLPRHTIRGNPCIGAGYPPMRTAREIVADSRARVRESDMGTTGTEIEKRVSKGRKR